MDRIVFKPLEVRGGGNIISPSKALGDFQRYQSTLELSSTTIDNQPVNVFTEEYLPGSYFTLQYSKWLPLDTVEFTVGAVLKTVAGVVISGASVTCTVNGEIVFSDTTDSNGEVVFTVPCTDYFVYSCTLEYEGDNNVAGCVNTVVTHLGEADTIDLIGEAPYTSVDEDKWLLATVTGHDGDHEIMPAPDVNINFYENIGYYRLLNIMTVSSESTGDNYCYSIGLDEFPIDISDKDFTLEFDYINSVNGGRLCLGDRSSWREGLGNGNNYIYCGTSTAGNGGYGTRYAGTTDNSSAGSVTAGDTLHYKIVRKGDTISYYLNGALKGTKTAEWIGTYHDWSLYLQCWGTGDYIVKNVVLDVDLRVKVSASPQIITTGDTTTITARVLDAIDGSRVGGETVNIYGEADWPDTRPIPTLSLASTSTLVNTGVAYTISGVLGNVSSAINKQIKIYENNVLIDTLLCDSGGNFSKTITKSVSGVFTYKAVKEESTIYQRAESNSVGVTVQDAVVIPDSISVESDSGVLSAYDSDSAVLTATVLDDADNPLSGQTVTMKAYKGSTLLNTLTVTDVGDGTYTASYPSTGAGDITIVAECDNLSDTCSIEDCELYDPTGFSITTTTSTDTSYPTGYPYSKSDTGNFQCEFDYECPASMRLYLTKTYIQQSGDNILYGVGVTRSGTKLQFTERTTSSSNTTCDTMPSGKNSFKWTFEGTTVKLYMNGVLQTTKTISWWPNNYPYYFGWSIWTRGTATVTNIKIKKL